MLKRKARPRRPRKVKGVMNATEKWYADNVLQPMKDSGEIDDFAYESETFEIAHRCGYTPDFILTKGKRKTIVEIKGSWSMQGADVTRVKIKVCARLFPEFVWMGVVVSGKKVKKVEVFKP